jgi:hypothetical protein
VPYDRGTYAIAMTRGIHRDRGARFVLLLPCVLLAAAAAVVADAVIGPTVLVGAEGNQVVTSSSSSLLLSMPIEHPTLSPDPFAAIYRSYGAAELAPPPCFGRSVGREWLERGVGVKRSVVIGIVIGVGVGTPCTGASASSTRPANSGGCLAQRNRHAGLSAYLPMNFRTGRTLRVTNSKAARMHNSGG